MPGEGPAYQGEDISMQEEPASSREQAEYERAIKAMERILFAEDRLADAIMKQIDPNDKVSSTTKATALLIQQLDEKIDMDETIIPQVTMDAVDTVTELAEARYGVSFNEQEVQATMGATWESVMAMFGVDEADYNSLRAELSEEDMSKLSTSHQGFLGQGTPVAQNAPPAVPAPAPPGAAPGGPVPMAGPPGAPAPLPGG
jgi:DNA gyrase/topoisomerase IV subunit A